MALLSQNAENVPMDVPLEKNLNIEMPRRVATKLTLRGIRLPNQILKERTTRVLFVLRTTLTQHAEKTLRFSFRK